LIFVQNKFLTFFGGAWFSRFFVPPRQAEAGLLVEAEVREAEVVHFLLAAVEAALNLQKNCSAVISANS
jgi:hypothetical protein